jgi:hypothetical protein
MADKVREVWLKVVKVNKGVDNSRQLLWLLVVVRRVLLAFMDENVKFCSCCSVWAPPPSFIVHA